MEGASSYWEQFGRVRRSRRIVLRTAAIGGAGLTAAGLAGCADDDDVQPTESADRQQPKRGGTIVQVNPSGDQPHHDPHLSLSGSIHNHGSGIVYSRLIQPKVSKEIGTINIIPEGDAAASWEQTDDTTYVFKLRPNVKWQNIAPVNGRTLTAQDVVFSYDRQLALKQTSANLPGLRRATAIDALTVRLELEKPDVDFLVALQAPQNSIIAREAVELKGDLKEGPVVGSGAWILKEWVPKNVTRLTRNPDYYKSVPYADNVEVLHLTDSSTRLAAFRSKQLHILDVTKDELDAIKSSNPDVQVAIVRLTGPLAAVLLQLRADIPPTSDIRVRRAVNTAIDRQTFIKTVLSGAGFVSAHGLLAATDEADLLAEEEVKKLLPAYDPAGARQLLQQAGVSGWKTSITTGGGTPEKAEFAQAQLKAIGVDSTIDLLNPVKFANWQRDHDLPVVVHVRGVHIFGVNGDLQVSYPTGAPRNVTNMSDPELDRLIVQQQAELKDRQRRRQLLHQIQRRILDVAAVTPIATEEYLVAYHPFLHGVVLSPNRSDRAKFEHLWLDR